MNNLYTLIYHLHNVIKYSNLVLSNIEAFHSNESFFKSLNNLNKLSKRIIASVFVPPDICINDDISSKVKTYHILLDKYKHQQVQLCDKDKKIKELENDIFKLSKNKEIIADNIIENFIIQQQDLFIIEKVELVPQYIYLEGPIVVPIQNKQTNGLIELSKSISLLNHKLLKSIPQNDSKVVQKIPQNVVENVVENNTKITENVVENVVEKHNKNYIYYSKNNILTIIKQLLQQKYGRRKITEYLNNKGYKNYYGNDFTIDGVRYIINKYIT
jgi:hypothetical protein